MQAYENAKSLGKRMTNIHITSGQVIARPNEETKTRDQVLSGFQKSVISGCVCIFLLLIFWNLFYQYKDAQIVQEIERYQLSVGELNTMSEGVRNEIYQKGNYEDIKKAAKQEKMTIVNDRVRNIVNENGQ